MRTILGFLLGILLIATIAATFPARPKSLEPLDGKIIDCSVGLQIAVIYFEGRAEFYLSDKTLFAVVTQDGDKVKIVILTPDKVIHEFSSEDEAVKTLGSPCEVAAAHRLKKDAI